MKTAKKIIMPNGEEIGLGGGIENKITNCLLEVPQRIKLKLNDGVLTLKAGSQVIVPNGFEADGVTKKFDYVDIESDISTAGGYNYTGDVFPIYDASTGVLFTERIGVTSSGATVGNYDTHGTWYDTTTNKVKRTSDSGATWRDGLSLPIGLCYFDNTTIQSISQTFNGFGYIGSTVWVDKGVKGLIPNGRNEDGTLKNIEVTTSNIAMATFTETRLDTAFVLYEDGTTYLLTGATYNEDENYIRRESTGNNIIKCVYIATGGTDSGKISNFTPKQPFRAVNYSDKAEVSGWGMPSGKYINLTLGASGTTYTAPANGWVGLRKTATAANQILVVGLGIQDFNQAIYSSAANQRLSLLTPVHKGDKVYIEYTLGGETLGFHFYYAQGEV